MFIILFFFVTKVTIYKNENAMEIKTKKWEHSDFQG